MRHLGMSSRIVAIPAIMLWSLFVSTAWAEPLPRGGSILAAIEHDLRVLVESVAPSVVTIRSACKHSGTQNQTGPSSLSIGSGIILDTLGRILTSSRVIENADEFWVETFDERIFPAALLGASGDIAVLEINAVGLKPAILEDAADLEVGSFVAAIGNSYGCPAALTWGEVNAIRPDGTLQLSLGVSAGSSGGALVDTQGKVIGLVKAKIAESYYLEGSSGSAPSYSGRRLDLPTSSVSLAIPIGSALRAALSITDAGFSTPGYVGVYVEDLTAWQAAHYRTKEGALVIGVVPGSPAERHGIMAGDLIQTVSGAPIASVRRFRQVVGQCRPGERLSFGLLRGGKPLRLTLETGRAELPVLEYVTSPVPVQTWNAAKEDFGSSRARKATPGSEDGAAHVSTSPAASSTSSALEARLLHLEQVIDSLQREVSALRGTAKR